MEKSSKKFLQLIKLDAIISDTEKRKFPVAHWYLHKVSALRNQREGLFQPCVFTILRFMKVRRRPETIFRVGLLDRQSEVQFRVFWLLFGTDGTVRFRRRKILWLLSVLVSWLLQFNSKYFPLTLSPKFYDGDSYLTVLGRMVAA